MFKIKHFFVVVVFLLPVVRPAFAEPNGDAQYWNTINVEGKIVKDLDLVIDEEFRFSYDMSGLGYQHTETGLKYKFTDWFNVMPAYRQIFYKSSGSWLREYTPNLNATFSTKLFNFSISDRSRLELRLFQNTKHKWTYRNKLDIRYPIQIGKIEFSPFTSEEMFILVNEGQFAQNRVYAGFGVKPMERMRVDLYYLWQTSDSGGTWINYNVFGTFLKFMF